MPRARLVLFLSAWALMATGAYAATPKALLEADIDLDDTASLQRGARTFVSYCLSCHAAAHMRYSRLGEDLRLPEKLVIENLMFTTDKIGATMTVAMRSEDAEQWFGVAPPDLSVIARARGADWIYTFLNSFYLDPKRPTGVNNTLVQGTAMPHVLWELQGWQRAVWGTRTDAQGKKVNFVERFELETPGRLKDADYRKTLRDLVGFLVYMGEPARLVRSRVGVVVMAFLVIFLIVVYLLKREYWKDVR